MNRRGYDPDQDPIEQWHAAGKSLIRAHIAGELILRGRWKGKGATVPIPKSFFMSGDAEIFENNITRVSHDIFYSDAGVERAVLLKAFPLADDAAAVNVLRGGGPKIDRSVHEIAERISQDREQQKLLPPGHGRRAELTRRVIEVLASEGTTRKFDTVRKALNRIYGPAKADLKAD